MSTFISSKANKNDKANVRKKESITDRQVYGNCKTIVNSQKIQLLEASRKEGRSGIFALKKGA